MWIKYNRYIKIEDDYLRWMHPDFTTDGRANEKYMHPSDNTLFLCNTIVEDFTGYESFNIVVVEDIKVAKREFNVGIMITKYALRCRFTFDEKLLLDNYKDVISSNTKTTPEEKAYYNSVMTTITKDFDSASEIDLTLPATIAAINFFALIGILTPERVTEVLEGV